MQGKTSHDINFVMNDPLIILNIGYALTFVALAIREVLWLRITLTAAQITLFTYHYFYAANSSASFWTSVFVIVNSYNIFKIFLERRPKIIPDEIRDLYEGIFKNLTASEFLYFWNMGTIKSVNDDYFIHSGEKQNNLLLVLSGMANVEVNKKPIASLGRGSFIAEISFLTGEPASADVLAKGEVIFIAWKSERLKNLHHDNSVFWMKLQHALSEDLIKKVKPQAKKESQIEKE
ncbi:MAG: cyclic nucleotide-binding domain-containing protein [Fidelibacterota bacterium]